MKEDKNTQEKTRGNLVNGRETSSNRLDGRSYNSYNERLKWKYLNWEKGANKKSEKTIDMIWRAIKVYEDFHGLKNLEKIASSKHITAFKTYYQKLNKSASTLLNITKSIKTFYLWLSKQSGYKSKINISDLEYFNLSNHEMMQAKKTVYKPFPTIDQLKKVIEAMPFSNEIERRNRALFSLMILTGMRVEAVISLRLKHIDIDREYVYQNGEEVNTKFRKTNHSFFLFRGNLKQIFVDWYTYLVKEKLYDLDDPLFPKALTEQDKNNSFKYEHISKNFLTSTGQVRTVFEQAFKRVGLNYYNPHSIRKTLENHIKKKYLKDLQKYQALSLNLGHSSMRTTLESYGQMTTETQEEILNQLKQEQENERENNE